MNKLSYFGVLLTAVICVNALGAPTQLESEAHQSNAISRNNQTQSYITLYHNFHKLQYLKHYRNLITSKIKQSIEKLPLYIYKQAKADTKDVVNNMASTTAALFDLEYENAIKNGASADLCNYFDTLFSIEPNDETSECHARLSYYLQERDQKLIKVLRPYSVFNQFLDLSNRYIKDAVLTLSTFIKIHIHVLVWFL